MEEDALDHALALRHFVQGFGTSRSKIYGIHPGVKFLSDGREIGEADAVILFESGGVALGEVKRRAKGLSSGDLARLDEMADRLDAVFTFVATPEPRRDCPDDFLEQRVSLPARPRHVLTGDELFARYPRWTLDRDPFTGPPVSGADEDQRERDFVDLVARHGGALVSDYDVDDILDGR
jgi:hypothetical protein